MTDQMKEDGPAPGAGAGPVHVNASAVVRGTDPHAENTPSSPGEQGATSSSVDTAVKFLFEFHAGARFQLTAIKPFLTEAEHNHHKEQVARWKEDKTAKVDQWPTTSTVIEPKDEAGARAFLLANWNWNLYHGVNPIKGKPWKKAEASDIASLAFLQIDVDPGAGRDLKAEQDEIVALLTDKLPKGVPVPSCVTFTGGGCQAFWRLKERKLIDTTFTPEVAKLYSKALEAKFNADNTHNIDRLMRVPFTWNRPDWKKLAKGRETTLAYQIDLNSKAYDLTDFEAATPSKTTATVAAVDYPPPKEVTDLELIGISGGSDLYRAITDAAFIKERYEGDRSDAVLRVVMELLRVDFPYDLILGIITGHWEVARHVLDQPDPLKYAHRQLDQGRKFLAEKPSEEKLQLNQDMKPYKNAHNFRVMCRLLGIGVRMNVFANRVLVDGLDDFGPELDDAAVNRIRIMIEERWKGFYLSKENGWDWLLDMGYRNKFHPVLDYLDSLKWDGVARIHTWLRDHASAKDTPFVGQAGALWLIAAVRRIRQPGCKFDEMLVFESPQGKNKSSALALMAVNEDWFLDDFPMHQDGKGIIEMTEGKWMVEGAELSTLSKASIEHVKATLSRRRDRGREAYGRKAKDHPRQWVAAGSTNSDRYLKDITGNRRFWPVAVGVFSLETVAAARDQLWAEAAHLEAQGASIRLDAKYWEDAAKEQEARQLELPETGMVRHHLGERNGKVPEVELWEVIGGQRTDLRLATMRHVMKTEGWTYKRDLRFGRQSGRVPGYWRGDEVERLTELRISRNRVGELVVTANEPSKQAKGRAVTQMVVTVERGDPSLEDVVITEEIVPF